MACSLVVSEESKPASEVPAAQCEQGTGFLMWRVTREIWFLLAWAGVATAQQPGHDNGLGADMCFPRRHKSSRAVQRNKRVCRGRAGTTGPGFVREPQIVLFDGSRET